MDRYYISIPDPTPTPEGFQAFRKDAFIEIVRVVLCAFYEDQEIIVANYLLESDIAHTDQQISEALALPQRQVRSVLEGRLSRDLITEAEVPNSGAQSSGSQIIPYAGTTSAWYRINPNILSATWYRLTQTERKVLERLKSVQETESYVCIRCGGREFDSLRAVSLFSDTDGLFHCDICEDILQVRQNRQLRERMENLHVEFRTQFETIKERLESMNKMFVPRPIVIKRSVHEKLLEQGRELTASLGTSQQERSSFSHLSAALNASISFSSGENRVGISQAPEWIREAQQMGSQGETGSFPKSEFVKVEELPGSKRLRVDNLGFELLSDHKDVKSIISSALSAKKEEPVEPKSEMTLINIGGVQYDLEEVRSNEALIDRMTDAEYTIFDGLLQSFGYR
jgi:transcription initiation factor IIE alpha subunit